ncbi:MAG: phosphate signaling complex protein PhoU [Polyangiaceae bacterium]|nr:phosphate signaling complex protein PhoU [Polyangiaceae bacterium]
MDRKHTDREYDRELDTLREQVLLMGARVEEMINNALAAFETRNIDLARQTIAMDRQIDLLEIDIDQMCIKVLARRQPVASDLRFVMMTFKHVTDLERIGDLGVNICERVLDLGDRVVLREAAGSVVRMGHVAQQMLHDALDAFVAADPHKAQEVIRRDQQVDTYYAQLFPELVTAMMQDPSLVVRATQLQSISKNIERIADHATNLAEMVVYMVKGQDVRHHVADANREN